MKCDQCEMLQISTGGVSLPCHETGCPNTNKVWDEEEQEWVDPEPDEWDEEDGIPDESDEDDDSWEY